MIKIIGKSKRPVVVHNKTIKFGETIIFDDLNHNDIAYANSLASLDLVSVQHVEPIAIIEDVEVNQSKTKKKSKLVE